MKQLLYTLMLLLFVKAIPLAAQNKISPEQKMIMEYYNLLYKQKDSLEADKVKARLLKKFPKGRFARRLASEGISQLQGEA